RIGAQYLQIASYAVVLGIEMPAGISAVGLFGQGESLDGGARPGEIVQVLLVLTGRVDGHEGGDDLRPVPLGSLGVQGVQPIMGGEGLRLVGPPAGEGRD